jgi:Txe/YoeB family toxin of Txe-Axe toxin-antitoxin module
MHTIDLSGKVALITGGGRGLGKAMSLGLADAGADIIIASRKLENCEAVAEQIRAKGRRALAIQAHTGEPEPLKHALSGYWSRRINDEHRLVYKVDQDALLIAQLRYSY